MSDGDWHEVQLQLDTVSGTTEVTLDGARIAALSGADSDPGEGIGRVELGERATGRTFDVAFDDVRVDTSPIADTTPPTRPIDLSATAASDRVDPSWTPATDNLAVDGYDVYRNGRLLIHIQPATSYVDRDVTPQTTYTYELRATDASENESAPSNG